nr:holo-ACP synthase [Flexivirga oryzae]
MRVGTDVQVIADIEASVRRHGRRYLDRVFTTQEVVACGGYDAEPNLIAPGLAARFSAKEALLKALRPTAIIPEWRDIEIVSMPGGWLSVQLTGAAKEIADESALIDLQVSVSHDGPVAVATVVGIERRRTAS